MTPNPKDWSEVLEFYYNFIRGKLPSGQAQRIENEMNTAIFRYLLPEFGFRREDDSRKMTRAETEQAKALLKRLSLQSLPKVRGAIQRSFVKLKVPKNSQNTYGSRINQWITWAENEDWWWNKRQRSAKLQEQCAPPRYRKYGAVDDTKLMPGKGRPVVYSLKITETPAALSQTLDSWFHFLSDPHHPQRVTDKIDEGTANGYIKEIRLFLGWFYRYRNPLIPLEQLSLNLLFSVADEDALEEMTPKQRKQFWRKLKTNLKQWIQDYFQFLAETQKSLSPRTRCAKLTTLISVGYFQYASQVESKEEYHQIPLFAALRSVLEEYQQQTKEWTINRQYVADQTKKWPEVPEGKTALRVIQEEVIEPLRRCCCPRASCGHSHSPHQLASFLEDFLVWSDLGLEPAGRQQEPRERRIALSCPIERPDSVPANGFYHPLPPEHRRERQYDGQVRDNYLFKAYELDGKLYPEGIWVKKTCKYKTRKFHGVRRSIIQNRQFADGFCLYDYLERYLYGWWFPGSFRNSQTYDWWDAELQGLQGRWITKGRMEFEPYDTCCLPGNQSEAFWSWGYLFPVPDLGTVYIDSTFSYAFAQPAHERIGKRITPHTMRYVWATWGFQVGLSDAQLRSLAYAMGSTVETLRKMYIRATPEQKRYPIEEAIDQLLFTTLEEIDEL